MVKFSCFHLCIHGKKPKRTTIQPSLEAMAKTLEDGAHHRVSKNSSRPLSSNPLLSKAPDKKKISNARNHGNNLSQDPAECGPQSKDPSSLIGIGCNEEVCHSADLKKSQALATELHIERELYSDNSTEGGIDSVFSYNDSKSENELPVSGCIKDQKANPSDHNKINTSMEFQVFSDFDDDYDDLLFSVEEDYDSTFSIQDPTASVSYVQEIYSTTPSAESAGRKQKEICIDKSEDQLWGEHAEENDMNNSFYDCDSYKLYPFSGVPKHWTMPVVGDMNSAKVPQEESHLDKLPKKYSHIQRTEDWVNSLQHCGPLEGISESSASIDPFDGDVNTMNHMSSARMLRKVAPGMASAMRYISSLSDNATAAQLADHGLSVIPFLCAFVSLKMVNLSGNAIVRITKGSLPRGLHILNLSNNNISNIEGLRELTRLCVLDLSYNRILRIGQGLASCSSLKELYLAGNGISELEGLHRLLKLTVLDLRFNKISTVKCLDQLAANYNSLKAISLEGNPAQKYVGDEQLRKYLLGFLPRLAYYNKHVIKRSTVKIAKGRSSCRSSIPISLDWRLRSDRENTIRVCHGFTALKASASWSQAYRSQRIYSPRKGFKSRHGHLPPIRSRIKLKSPSF